MTYRDGELIGNGLDHQYFLVFPIAKGYIVLDQEPTDNGVAIGDWHLQSARRCQRPIAISGAARIGAKDFGRPLTVRASGRVQVGMLLAVLFAGVRRVDMGVSIVTVALRIFRPLVDTHAFRRVCPFLPEYDSCAVGP